MLVEAHDAEVRHERRERVVGDLRLGRARPPRSASTCPRSGSRRARRRRAASARAGASASSPYSPCSANDGARRAFERKRALPRPPLPPRAASQRSPSATRSASSSPSERGRPCPRVRRSTRSAPAEPCFFLPEPCVPDVALRCGWSRNASSDATLRFARSQTSPPLPPSPPSGPPCGTCASRRNATAPAPPSPAFTLQLRHVDEVGHHRKRTGERRTILGVNQPVRTPATGPRDRPAAGRRRLRIADPMRRRRTPATPGADAAGSERRRPCTCRRSASRRRADTAPADRGGGG